MKRLFSFAAILAALSMLTFSCTKENSTRQEELNGKTITFKASISEPSTKTSYSESAAGVISATFAVDDKIMAFDPEGNQTIFTATAVDDEGVATFTGTPTTPFADGATITAVLLNNAVEDDNYNSETKTIEAVLDYQTGTLDNAGKNEVLFGQGTYNQGAADALPMTFTRKSAIIKFVLTLPSGENPEKLTDIYLSSGTTSTKTYKNRIDLNVVDGSVSYSQDATLKGDLKIKTEVAVTDNKAEVYFAVPSYALQNAIIQATPTDNMCKRYVWRVAGSAALTPAAGYCYTITRNSPRMAWSSSSSLYLVNDDAVSINGVDIPANTTGKPVQTATSSDLWGYTYNLKVTQVEIQDLLGSATFTGDTRKATTKGTVAKATTTNTTGAAYGKTGGVTSGNYYDDAWTAPSAAAGTETAITISESGDATYNLNVSGLYENLVMPAKAAIDYDNNTLTFNLRIENKLYSLTSGTFSGEYAMFATELYNGGSTYYLGFANGGAFDYVGIAGMSSTGMTITFAEHQKCTAYTSYYVKGIMINRFAGATNSGSYLIRSTNNAWDYKNYKLSGAAYAWITQGTFTITR